LTLKPEEEAVLPRPRFTPKSGIFIAVMSAVSIVSTVTASFLVLGPNINFALDYFAGVIVGSSLGIVPGIIAGFLGMAYTPILWGNPWNWIFTVPVGALTGLFAVRVGLRPILAAGFAQLIAGVPSMVIVFLLFGLPNVIWTTFWWLVLAKQTSEIIVSALIAEAAFNSKSVSKWIPRATIRGPKFVLKSSKLRNPLYRPPESV
jgi:hypothetical protein